jgi:DNA-nicking Smr family endonuclease
MTKAKPGKGNKTSGSPFDALKGMRDTLAKQEETKHGKGAPSPAVRPSSTARPSTSLSPDEPRSFAEFMAQGSAHGSSTAGASKTGVTRERSGQVARDDRAAEREQLAERAREEEREARRAFMALTQAPTSFEVEDDGQGVYGRRVDAVPTIARRLRRGEYHIDSRLDLHGMRVEEARTATEDHLARARARGDGTVLIIHGRGLHSPGGQGLLRGEVAAWLSQGRAAAHVDAFASAQPDDGGFGAVVVALRR